MEDCGSCESCGYGVRDWNVGVILPVLRFFLEICNFIFLNILKQWGIAYHAKVNTQLTLRFFSRNLQILF